MDILGKIKGSSYVPVVEKIVEFCPNGVLVYVEKI